MSRFPVEEASIRIIERDGAESRAEVTPLAAAVYPPEVLAIIVWRNVVSARATRRIMVFDDDDRLVAATGMIFRNGLLNGVPVAIGGIGGVMTAPDRRRQGFGRAAVDAAVTAFERAGSPEFGLLFCEAKNIGFYERLGWLVFDGKVLAEQPPSIAVYDIMTTMVRALGAAAPRAGVIDLCGLPW